MNKIRLTLALVAVVIASLAAVGASQGATQSINLGCDSWLCDAPQFCDAQFGTITLNEENAYFYFNAADNGGYWADSEGNPDPDGDAFASQNGDEASEEADEGNHFVTVTYGACPANAGPSDIDSGYTTEAPTFNDRVVVVECSKWDFTKAPIAALGYTPKDGAGGTLNTETITVKGGASYGLAGSLPTGYALVKDTWVGIDGTVFTGAAYSTVPCLYPLASKA